MYLVFHRHYFPSISGKFTKLYNSIHNHFFWIHKVYLICSYGRKIVTFIPSYVKITHMMNRVLKWSATAVTIAGAVLTSLNLFPWNVAAFNIGSVLWLLFAFRIQERSLIVVNAALLMIYMVGLFV